MLEVTTIGLDIAKSVFHAHGADERGTMMFSRKLTRGKLLEFLARQPRCTVALEACGGAHHWARELQALGHEVRLVPPAVARIAHGPSTPLVQLRRTPPPPDPVCV